jgi:formylglycine-generating enzyme required for sulfatase activity/tetratricopeptide (TPR) repeat protein
MAEQIYISYARPDQVVAQALAAHLTSRGYEVWWDEKLTAGEDWRKTTQEQMRIAAAVIVIWSTDSVKSDIVATEAHAARLLRKLVQVRLQDLDVSKLPLGFHELQVILETDREALYRILDAALGSPPATVRNDEAELLRQAIALREKSLGSDHPDVAALLNNLANLYITQGRIDEAEPLYQRALAIQEKAPGSHRAVATALGNLAKLYEAQGRYVDAEPLYRQAQALHRQVLRKNVAPAHQKKSGPMLGSSRLAWLSQFPVPTLGWLPRWASNPIRTLRRLRTPQLVRTAARILAKATAATTALAGATYLLALAALHDLEQPGAATVAGTAHGELAAAIDATGATLLWRGSAATGVLSGHQAPLASVDFAHGTTLLSSAHDGTVRLTDTRLIERAGALAMPGLSRAVHDRVWKPYGVPLATLALKLTAQLLPLSIPETRKGRRGRAFRDCPECPEMIEIEPGAFLMGSPLTEPERYPSQSASWFNYIQLAQTESPRQLITITSRFAVGRLEVTFAEWDACVAAGGCERSTAADQGWGRERRPAINVSWNDAKSYVAWINSKTSGSYRLLTEPEWEYVARAGTTTRLPWTKSAGPVAVCKGCGSAWDGKQTAPVGSLFPNAFGVYDMHGNVWEWLDDCWRDNYLASASSSEAGCRLRVIRGGSWNDPLTKIRAASRGGASPATSSEYVGFRLARTL